MGEQEGRMERGGMWQKKSPKKVLTAKVRETGNGRNLKIFYTTHAPLI